MATYLRRAGQILMKPVEWKPQGDGIKYEFITKEGESCSGLIGFTKKDGSPNESMELISNAFEKGEFLLMEVQENGKYFNAKWAVTPKAGGGAPGNKSSADLKAYLAKRASEPKAPEGAPALDDESIPF